MTCAVRWPHQGGEGLLCPGFLLTLMSCAFSCREADLVVDVVNHLSKVGGVILC